MSKLKKVDSYTNVDVDALNEEEKTELLRIRSKIDAQRRVRDQNQKRHICIRYNLWFYAIILLIAILFIFSVIFSVTGIRNLGLKPPSCVMSDDPYRLPDSIIPLDYSVRLRMNFSGRSFHGRADISIEPKENTYCLFFNVDPKIVIQKFFVMDSESMDEKTRALEIRKMEYNEKTEIYKIMTEEFLHTGRIYKFYLSYEGFIKEDELEGMYVSYYEYEDRRMEVFSTHFEASAARSVFPCFDEPRFKASFTLELEIPKTSYSFDPSFKIVTNTPLKEIVPMGKGDQRYVFQSTPKMSTYLVAFAMGPLQVSRYHNVSVIVNKNVELGDTQMILEIAYEIVESLSDFFKHDYYDDIKKLDLLGLSNFRAGAMENWGLITFRESLVVTPHNATERTISRNTQVTAHEIAHQWLGNLVTPQWWSDIFLNEAGATFFQYLALHLIRPKWKVWEDFVTATLPPALEKDALPSCPSLISPVVEGLEISSKFDAVSYNKGGSILKMLWDYLGHDRFRKWINGFLKPRYHSCSNHTEYLDSLYPLIVRDYESLRNYLEKRDEESVDEISPELQIVVDDVKKVSSWYTSNGYPVITVTRVHGSTYNLHQKRFLSYVAKEEEEEEGGGTSSSPLGEDYGTEDTLTFGTYLWWIPIRYFTSSVTRELRFVEMNERNVEISVHEDWFKLNADSAGFFRVNYLPEQWTKLKNALYHHPSMTLLDRVSLIDDGFSLGEAGEADVGIGLEIGLVVRDSGKLELKAWNTILRHIVFQNSLIIQTSSRGRFQKYVGDLSGSLGFSIGWVDDEKVDEITARKHGISLDNVHELRKVYITLLRISSNESAFDEIYLRYRYNLDEVPDYLFTEILSILVNIGDVDIVGELWEKYEETKRDSYLYILGQSNDPVQFMKALGETLSDNVLSQDGHFIIRSISSNVQATSRVFDWVRQNIGPVSKKFGMTSVNNYVLPGLAGHFNEEVKEKDLKMFFVDYATERSLQLALEMVQRNRWWLQNILHKVDDWLAKRYR